MNWKDKQGNKLTFKEFIERWKEGIEGITPKQKLKSQISGTKITLIGLLCGLCITLYNYKTLWWIALILTGGFIVTWVQYIGFKQQYKAIETIEMQCTIQDTLIKKMSRQKPPIKQKRGKGGTKNA